MIGDDLTQFGFIAVIGSPNGGKSTLVNRFVGAKVSIVTQKVQTTRIKVRGIAVRGNCQLVFIDTPGIFQPRRRLEKAMVDSAWRGVADAERILLVVDANRGIDADIRRILGVLNQKKRPKILLLNKIDLIRRERLLALSDEINNRCVFEETFMISALRGDGVDDVLNYLAKLSPEGPWMFPDDQISDLPKRVMAAEITREFLFILTHQEIPYAATVETDSWKEYDDGSIKILQTLYVKRASQKAIILGKNGGHLKDIGTAARLALGKIFERKVHLFIHVKVRGKWMEDSLRYKALGLAFDDWKLEL